MKVIDSLKQTTSLYDFSKFLGYKESSLAYILYSKQYKNKYTSFTIPKKNGGTRSINAPDCKLKKVQKILSEKLQKCYEEIQQEDQRYLTANYVRKKIVHSYRPNTSIETNAFCHRNKRFVLNLDLNNFFPCINFGRIYGYFIKDKNFCLNPKVSTIIAQLSCYNNELPQGAPTSPVIANFIAKILDIKLLKLAKEYNLTYTRYADDITFSCNSRSFPENIAFVKNGKWILGNRLVETIKQSGFSINNLKTRMHYNNSRQDVTGLVVNRKVNVKREYYKKIRAQCYSLFNKGYFYDEKDKSDINALKKLEGRLNFVFYAKNFENKLHRTDTQKQEESRKNFIKITGKDKFFDNKRNDNYAHISLIKSLPSVHKLYFMFLFYKYFVYEKQCLILCEGKTDNIYIKCAIDKLRDKLDFNHSIKFTPHSKILNLLTEFLGGTSKLKKFCNNYQIILEGFKAAKDYPPLIIVVDNDNDGRDVAANKNFINIDEDIKFMKPNLYVLTLPCLSKSSNTIIEDYFDDKIKIFEGKTFNAKNQQCTETEFGKNVFATQVVLKHKNDIDFSKFVPLLQKIDIIINSHYPK